MKTFVVIQGPLTHIDQMIECWSKWPNVVWSTWHGVSEESKEKLEQSGIVLVESEMPSVPGYGNVNLQAAGSTTGILMAGSLGATHAFRVRSDIIVSDPVKLIQTLEQDHEDARLAALCHHNHRGGYLVDYIQFGELHHILDWWSVRNPSPVAYPAIVPSEVLQIRQFAGHTLTLEQARKMFKFILPILIDEDIEMRWLKMGIDLRSYDKDILYDW